MVLTSSEITFWIILVISPVGPIIQYLIKKSQRLKDLQEIYSSESRETEQEQGIDMEVEPELHPILIDNEKEIAKLDKIAHKISDNYRLILPIYGILLAFVVSDKILLVFRSAFFVMWTGMVIALIVRAGGISIELSDVIETKSLATVKKKVFAAKKFFTFSLSMLILTVALLPAFFLIPPLTDTEKANFEQNFYMTIFSGGITLLSAFLLFYLLPFEVSKLGYSYKMSSMYAITGILIFFGALVYPIPLTASMSLNLGGQSIPVPIILLMVVLSLFLYGVVMIAKLIGLGCMLLPKKYRKMITKAF